MHGRQSPANRRLADRQAIAHRRQRGERRGGVVALMFAAQRDVELAQMPAEAFEVNARARAATVRAPARQKRRAALGGDPHEHIQGLAVDAPQHDRPTRFDDAALFGGDLGEGIAEPFRVIAADRRHDGHRGIDYVGGIEPSPEADLDDRSIHTPAGEMQKGHDGEDFEEGQIDAAGRRSGPDVGGKADHFRGLDFLRADANALRQVDQVRRGVEADPVPGGAQHRVHHRGDRTLPVGPRDVQDRKTPLRIAQALQCQRHALELEVHPAGRLERIQPLDRAVVLGHRVSPRLVRATGVTPALLYGIADRRAIRGIDTRVKGP